MKRLESNLLNMLLSLTIVTLAAAALLGGLYVLTEEPIAKQKADKQEKAITSVLPQVEGMQIAEAEETDNGIIIYRAYDAEHNYIGAAVQTSENGFGGKFKLMVGFDRDGNIVNYEVLEHQETPGLGDHMTDWFKTDKNRQSVIGKNTATTNFTVSKDRGDVDAITAATISSRAFLKAVVGAYDVLKEPEVQASTGATALQEETEQPADSLQTAEPVASADTIITVEEVKQEKPAEPVKKSKKKKTAKVAAAEPVAVPVAEPKPVVESVPAQETAQPAENVVSNPETTQNHE